MSFYFHGILVKIITICLISHKFNLLTQLHVLNGDFQGQPTLIHSDWRKWWGRPILKLKQMSIGGFAVLHCKMYWSSSTFAQNGCYLPDKNWKASSVSTISASSWYVNVFWFWLLSNAVWAKHCTNNSWL